MPFYFGTNLKMNQTPAEAQAFVEAIVRHRSAVPRPSTQLWVIPSYTNLTLVAEQCKAANIWLGAQNMHWEDAGAYTGEISPAQLKGCGVDLIMLGHAERRTLFGETDERLNQKVHSAVRHDLRIMLCVGETGFEKAHGTGDDYVARQLKIDLHGLSDPSKLMILYEPIWSVGPGGIPAEPAYVSAAFANIRRVLVSLFPNVGQQIPILYGGSVNADNCARYAHLPNCAGIGVGRAAWQAEAFLDVLAKSLGDV